MAIRSVQIVDDRKGGLTLENGPIAAGTIVVATSGYDSDYVLRGLFRAARDISQEDIKAALGSSVMELAVCPGNFYLNLNGDEVALRLQGAGLLVPFEAAEYVELWMTS